MARKTPLWQQSGNYSAQADRGLMAALWPAGGVSGGAVTAVNNTMQVSVAPGSAAVPLVAGQGCALCTWDAAEVVTLTAAPPSGQSRVDLVAVQYRDASFDGGANNDFVMVAVAGTPATTNPAVPATPNNAYVLARVTVPGAAANLNTATITNVAATLQPVAGTLLATTRAAPAAQGTYTIGGTAQALNAFAVTFTAPPSGRVLVRWNGFVAVVAGGTGQMQFYLGAAAAGGAAYLAQPVGNNFSGRLVVTELLSGLVPGQSYTVTPYGFSNAFATYIYYGGPGTIGNFTGNAGPAITEVYAA
jgi:hypothetical protein